MSIEKVDSQFIPEGMSVFRSGETLAVCNHKTGKVLVIPPLTILPPKMEIEQERKGDLHVFTRYMRFDTPSIFRPSVVGGFSISDTITKEDFHADAYGILRPQHLKDAARCRQRHYRAKRQGGRGR